MLASVPVEEGGVQRLLQRERDVVTRQAHGKIVKALNGASDVSPVACMVVGHDLWGAEEASNKPCVIDH